MKPRHRVRRAVTLGALTYLGGLIFSVWYLTTPRRIARLIAELCRPEAGMSCYDPCCGSGRLPRAVQRAASRSSDGHVRTFAQEINPISFLAAAGNRKLHGLEMTVKLGSSIGRPAFTDENGELQRFDLAVASPPWNLVVREAIYHNDRFKRFIYGWPSHNGDWIWMQHILAHLEVDGRMVVMLDREATSRADDAEVDVRQRFVESDLIEAVVLCPWQISRPRWLANFKIQDAVLIVVNKAKKRSGEILFVDTRPLVTDYLTGRLTSEDVHNVVMEALQNWTTLAGVAQIAPNDHVAKTGYNLAPELYCAGQALSR